METKLLPCPFCGGAAAIDDSPGPLGYVVYCPNEKCPVEPEGIACHDRDVAIAAWNTRAPSPLHTVAELMEGALQYLREWHRLEHQFDPRKEIPTP
jgi:Restriction alleviation protein Lar